MKISALPVLTAPAADDLLVVVDDSADTTKQMKLSTLINLFYPIGSIYSNGSDSTNPATLFGFGTWEAYAPGRTIVGKSASGTFGTLGDEMGEEAHTLNTTEMPAHAHGVYDPGHNHSSANGQQVAIAAGSTNKLTLSGGAQQITWGNTNTSVNGSNIGIYNSGGGAAHNNIQPSKVAHLWIRTA